MLTKAETQGCIYDAIMEAGDKACLSHCADIDQACQPQSKRT